MACALYQQQKNTHKCWANVINVIIISSTLSHDFSFPVTVFHPYLPLKTIGIGHDFLSPCALRTFYSQSGSQQGRFLLSFSLQLTRSCAYSTKVPFCNSSSPPQHSICLSKLTFNYLAEIISFESSADLSQIVPRINLQEAASICPIQYAQNNTLHIEIIQHMLNE